MRSQIRAMGWNFAAKTVLAVAVLSVANAVFTLFDHYWQLLLTGVAVATLGVLLDRVVLPAIGSFPSLYVDKMGFLLVISLLSLGLSGNHIVPFYMAEAVAILLAACEEWLHRMVLPRSMT